MLVGITEHAQQQLGDIVFVELPESGVRVQAGQDIVVIESVKAAADLYAPLAGVVLAHNDALIKAPGDINRSPYEAGWCVRLGECDRAAFDALLSETAYQQVVAELGQG